MSLSERGAGADLADFLAGIDPDVARQQLVDRLGIRLTEINSNQVTGVMPVTGNLQPYGLLHGGANAVLAETLGTILAATVAGHTRIALGLELSCTHHRAVREGQVSGRAVPIHVGRGAVTTEIVISDESNRRTCTARLTCLLRDNKMGDSTRSLTEARSAHPAPE